MREKLMIDPKGIIEPWGGIKIAPSDITILNSVTVPYKLMLQTEGLITHDTEVDALYNNVITNKTLTTYLLGNYIGELYYIAFGNYDEDDYMYGYNIQTSFRHPGISQKRVTFNTTSSEHNLGFSAHYCGSYVKVTWTFGSQITSYSYNFDINIYEAVLPLYIFYNSHDYEGFNHLTFKRNNINVADFRAAKRNSDNKQGIYNTVNNNFFPF